MHENWVHDEWVRPRFDPSTDAWIVTRGGGAASPGPSCAAFATFQARGVANVRLNVDRDNASGATHPYQRAGMRLRRRWVVVAKTLTA